MAKYSRLSSRGASDEMMDSENQAATEQLASKVGRLKNLAFDIEVESKDQNRYLGNVMDGEMNSAQGLLGGTMNRLSNMMGKGKDNRRIMCYIILFLVGLFVLFYYVISKVRG